MKKKLMVTIAVVLLLAMAMTLFVGCDEIFKKNDKRDATQVVATVTYHGRTENVYKFELATSFNSYAYYYVNYYGMTYEQTANYLARSLAQQKLLTLYAMEKVAQLKGLDAVPTRVEDLLSDSEKNRAVEKTNESFVSSLKTIVKNNITEDNYNSGTVATTTPQEEVEITDAVYVKFDSNGGSAVEKQKLQNGQSAKEPEDPTKSGYTFYGWYANSDLSGEEYDFASAVEFDAEAPSKTLTLYAKWEKYTTPRTERPEEKEDEDKDYDPDLDGVEISKTFFEMSIDELYEEFKDEDFVSNIRLQEGEELETVLRAYIGDGIAELKNNMAKTVYKETAEEGYAYYLKNQQDSLLIERLKRMIGDSVTVSDEEVEREFAAAVAQNKETFANSETAYSSALTNALTTTYYHPQDQLGYGFVANILLKLDDESLKVLTDLNKNNPLNDAATLAKRNQLVSQIMVMVSNPNYKASAVIEDADGNKIDLRDTMTDARNPYNKVGKTDENPYDASKEVEGGNNYSQILSFEKDEDGVWGIKFNATQHEAMPYLVEKVPAFDKDGQVGIIHQIQNSLQQVRDAVTAGELTKEQGVYWLRKVATEWLYLVGDDAGAVSSDSNNNGLGYLINPEGEKSNYLEDFTNFARDLITAGTGASSVGALTDDMYAVATSDGTLAGNGIAYVVADSFIENDSTSNPYAGVFVLLNTLTVWDETLYGTLPEDGVIPTNYVVNYAEDMDDVQTIYDVLKETLEGGKKEDAYNLDVNTMGIENEDAFVLDEKVIKSLWEKLD